VTTVHIHHAEIVVSISTNSFMLQEVWGFFFLQFQFCFPFFSLLAMKLLHAAVLSILAPALTPAMDPLSAYLIVGGAAISWQLFSPHSWLRCSLLECCNAKETLNFSGKAVGRAVMALPGVGRVSQHILWVLMEREALKCKGS